MTKLATPLATPDAPFIPDVIFSRVAWAKTQFIITAESNGDNEITWFGVVSRTPEGHVYIDNVYVPVQVVTGTNTDCDDYGIVMAEAHADGHNPMTTRAWFHKHPKTMGTTPSGVDEATTKEFLEDKNWPYLVRGIFNNIGSINMAFYDKETNLKYTGLTTRVDDEGLFDREVLIASIKERVTPRPIKTYVSPKHVTNGMKPRGYYCGATKEYILYADKEKITGTQLAPVEPASNKHYKDNTSALHLLKGLTNKGFNHVNVNDFIDTGGSALVYNRRGVWSGDTLYGHFELGDFDVTDTMLNNWQKQFAIKDSDWDILMGEFYEDESAVPSSS
jgi:hypothetical protein